MLLPEYRPRLPMDRWELCQELVAVTWTRRLSSAVKIPLYATRPITLWLAVAGDAKLLHTPVMRAEGGESQIDTDGQSYTHVRVEKLAVSKRFEICKRGLRRQEQEHQAFDQ